MTEPLLHLGAELVVPLSIVSRRTAVVGQTDTGKTSTAVVLVEEAHRQGAQVVILDPTGAWWGITSSVDGKRAGLDMVVMGGEHGDVPLNKHAGKAVARLVATEGYSPVLDLDRPHFTSWYSRQLFVADFLTDLFEHARSQILVVIDEAHRFAPQGAATGGQWRQADDESSVAARCLTAVVDAVALGRRRGIGVVVITQRLAKLHKDVLEMCEIMVAHRLRGTNDLKALRGWLEEGATDIRSTMGTVAGLEKGVAHVSAPTLDIDGVFKIRAKETFDSSRSIGVGDVALEPTSRAHVDMAALEALMADTIEEAKAEDPRELRKRIAALERQLADRGPERVEVPVVPPEVLEAIARADNELGKAIAGAVVHSEVLGRVASSLRGIEISPQVAAAGSHTAPSTEHTSSPAGVARVPEPTRPDAVASPRPAAANNGDGPALKAGMIRMLDVLRRYGPLARRDLAVLSRVSPVSGTVSDYLGVLVPAGLATEADGLVSATKAGIALVRKPGPQPGPFTPEEVYEMWQGDLKAGARRMVEQLIAAYPRGFTRKELAGLVGISAQSGTVSDYLGVLRRRGLAVERSRRVYAGDALYLGGAQA